MNCPRCGAAKYLSMHERWICPTCGHASPRVEASHPTEEIGVLFEIDELSKLGRGQYGPVGWTVVMRACDPLPLRGCTLFSGDALGMPGADRNPMYYCIGIQPLQRKQLESLDLGNAMTEVVRELVIKPELAKNRAEYFRETLLRRDDRGLLARERRFVEGDVADRHQLPIDGFIDGSGRFVMADTECYWLFEVAAKCGWRYRPSDGWLGKFAAEYLRNTGEDNAFSWPADFAQVACRALRQAGRAKTLTALRQYLETVRDQDTKRVCEQRWKAVERDVFRAVTEDSSMPRRWWQLRKPKGHMQQSAPATAEIAPVTKEMAARTAQQTERNVTRRQPYTCLECGRVATSGGVCDKCQAELRFVVRHDWQVSAYYGMDGVWRCTECGHDLSPEDRSCWCGSPVKWPNPVRP